MQRMSLVLSGTNDVHTFCPDADADNLFEGGRQSGNSLYKGVVHTGVGGWFYLTELAGELAGGVIVIDGSHRTIRR